MTGTESDAPDSTSPPPTLEGLEVGAYTLDRLVGHGGMGAVWLAHRTDGRFEGRVAVKLMNLALLGSSGLERFRREGSLLARLAHPGIARLLDAGVATTRQPYLVIEFIDGAPIDRFAAEHSLSLRDRIGLVLQVLDGLTHAHANLVVHRDIKPSNILVTDSGAVKLLDFGIAKLLDGETGGGPTALTADGGRPFTPDFAAPEQVLGEPITTATDVYSVGVLLYLLVAGHHPAAAPGRPTGAFPTLLDIAPRPLGLGDLDSVLGKALRKVPGERYQTAAEFADDLRRYLAQQPVRARPDSVAYRLKKFVRRHRAAVGLGTVAGLALIGVTAFALRQMEVARRERNEAVRSSRRESAMSELQGVLATDTRGPDGAPLSMAARVDRAAEVLARRYTAEPWIVATVLVDLSGRYFETGDLGAQRTMLARAESVARRANLPEPLALAVCTRSINWWLIDSLAAAKHDVDAGRAALAGVAAPDPTVQSICLEAEAKWNQAQGNADRAVELLETALRVAESDPSGSRRLPVENALGEILRLSGRTRQAVPIFRRILAELDSLGYGDTDAWPNIAGFLAASLTELGQFAELDSNLRVMVATRQRGVSNARIAPRLAFLYGANHLALRAIDSADWWITRATSDSSESTATFARHLTAARVELRLDQGRWSEARTAGRELPTDSRGQRAAAAMLRAELRRAEGDPAGADRALERELGVLSTDGRPALPAFTLPLLTAAEWRLERGELDPADSIARLARAAAAIDSVALTRSALAGRAELVRARILMAKRDLPNARKAAERAVVALGAGYGTGHGFTRDARRLVDSLAR